MKKFPLDPLVELRAHAVGERSLALSDRTQQVRLAQQSHALAEQRQRTQDAEQRAVVASEKIRLTQTEVTVADFLRLSHYLVGAASTADNLRQQSALAQLHVKQAESAQLEALDSLAEARAEQRGVDSQKMRFVAAERAAVEAAAEEDALETWSRRRH